MHLPQGFRAYHNQPLRLMVLVVPCWGHDNVCWQHTTLGRGSMYSRGEHWLSNTTSRSISPSLTKICHSSSSVLSPAVTWGTEPHFDVSVCQALVSNQRRLSKQAGSCRDLCQWGCFSFCQCTPQADHADCQKRTSCRSPLRTVHAWPWGKTLDEDPGFDERMNAQGQWQCMWVIRIIMMIIIIVMIIIVVI